MAHRDFKGGKDMARFVSSKALKVNSTMVGRKGLHVSQFGDLIQVLNHDASIPSDSRAFPRELDSDNNDGSHKGSAARNNGDLDDKDAKRAAAPLGPNMETLNPTDIMVFSSDMDEDVLPLKATRVSDLHEGVTARVSHEETMAKVSYEGVAAKVLQGRVAARVSHERMAASVS